jgi:hypothetical protein
MLLRGRIFSLAFLSLLIFTSINESKAQCPTFSGATYIPNLVQICATPTMQPEYEITYGVSFLSNVAAGLNVSARYDWGDGNITFYSFGAADGSTKTFIAPSQTHVYPNSPGPCEYTISITMRVNFVACPGTLITDQLSSWERDNNNGGVIQMVSPISGTDDEPVCEGVDVNVVFDNTSTFNCQNQGGGIPKIPNEEARWEQFVYNTGAIPAKIPNAFLNGVTQLTGAGGVDVNANVQDPRGVVMIPASATDASPKRTTLPITAVGGFGPGFPVEDDQIEVTLRMWNFCNPYDDPNIPGPPADLINGDNAPLESTATVTIVTSPDDPITDDNNVCFGDPAPPPFSFAVPAGFTNTSVQWYQDAAGAPGALIPNGANNTSLTTANYQPGGAIDTNVPGIYTVWAGYNADPLGTGTCESEVLPMTLRVREDLTINPITWDNDPGTNVCAGSTGWQFSLPVPAAAETFGGATEYVWSVSGGGVSVASTTATTATIDVNAATSGLKTVSVFRRYTGAPNCPTLIETFDFTVDPATNVGTLSGGSTPICEGSSIGTISLNGEVGTIVNWERDFNGNNVWTDLGNGGNDSFTETLNVAGTYRYRVIVKSGVCSAFTQTPANYRTIVVNDKPVLADLSGDNTICETDPSTLNIAITDGTAPYTITIDNGVGSFAWSSSADDPVVNPLTTTTYSITSVVDFNGCTPNSITGSATITIGNPTDATITGDAAICNNGNTDLQVNIVGGSPSPTYTINITNVPGPDIGTIVGYTSGANIPTGALTNTTVYTLNSVLDVNNCPVLGISDDEATVTVGVAVSNATVTVADVCDTDDFIFSVNITDGAPPYNINYSIDGLPPVNEPNYTNGSNIVLPAQSVGTHTVDVVLVTDACGTTFGPIPQASIEVFPLPIAVDQTPAVCSDAAGGTTATVDLVADNNALINPPATTTITYWENYAAPNFSTSIATPTNYVVTDGVSVYARVEDTSDPTACVNVAVITYDVNPTPNNATGSTDLIACSPDIATASISVDDPLGSLTIDWFAASSGGFPLPGGTGTISFVPGAAGTYYAEVRNTATTCTSLGRIPVTLTEDFPPSTAGVVADFDTCEEDNVSLTVDPATLPIASGSGIWTYETGLIWRESFDDLPLDEVEDLGATGWTVDSAGVNLAARPGHMRTKVNPSGGKWFEFNNVGNPVNWISEPVNISAAPGDVTIQVTIDEPTGGQLNNSDYIEGFYTLDGSIPTTGSNVLFARRANDFNSTITESLTITPPFGAGQLRMLIIARNTNTTEFHRINSVTVYEEPTGTATIPIIADPYATTTTVNGLDIGVNAFNWTVYSDLGVCPASSATLSIRRIELPEVVDPAPLVCADDDTSSPLQTTVTLQAYDDDVNGTALLGDRNVEYYDDNTYSTLIDKTLPYTFDATDNVIYTRVIRTDETLPCFDEGVITFNIVPLPEAIDQDDGNNANVSLCEDNVGSNTIASVDLTAFNDAVTNIVGSTNRTVDWYEDAPFGTPVGNPLSVTVNTTTNASYYAVVTIDNAPTPACTNTAQVDFTVLSLPTANPIAGSNTVCVGQGAEFYDVNLGPAGTTYSWTFPTIGTYVAGGGPGDFFLLWDFGATPGTTEVKVIETSPDGCDGLEETLAVDVVAAPPAPVITPDIIGDVCENDVRVYTVPFAAGTTYSWTKPADANIVSGQGTNSIQVVWGATPGNIEVTPTATGCAGGTGTLNVGLTRLPILDPNLDKFVCSGEDIDLELIADGASPVGASTFNITASAPGLIPNVGPSIGNGVPFDHIKFDNYTNKTAVSLFAIYTVTPVSLAGCEGDPEIILVEIRPEPYLSTALDNTVCSDINSGLTMSVATGSAPAIAYDYILKNDNGLPDFGPANAAIPSTVPFPLGATDDYLINDAYENTTGSDVTVEYTVVPISGDLCRGDPLLVNLVVQSKPLGVDETTNPSCSGSPVNYDLENNISTLGNMQTAGNTYSWIATTNGNVDNESDGLGGTGKIITDPLVNLTNSPQTVIYTVTATSADGCASSTFQIDVPVEPTPVMTATLNPATTTICDGDAINIDLATLTTPNTPADITWSVVVTQTGGSGVVAGAAFGDLTDQAFTAGTATLAGNLTNTGNDAATVRYVFTPNLAGVSTCAGTALAPIDIIVEPTPVMTATLNPATTTICDGDAINIDLATLTTPNTPADITWSVVVTQTGGSGVVAGTAFGDLTDQAFTAGTATLAGNLTNTGNDAATVRYVFTPNLAGVSTCAGTALAPIDIIVEPTPVMTATLKSGDDNDL